MKRPSAAHNRRARHLLALEDEISIASALWELDNVKQQLRDQRTSYKRLCNLIVRLGATDLENSNMMDLYKAILDLRKELKRQGIT